MWPHACGLQYFESLQRVDGGHCRQDAGIDENSQTPVLSNYFTVSEFFAKYAVHHTDCLMVFWLSAILTDNLNTLQIQDIALEILNDYL